MSSRFPAATWPTSLKVVSFGSTIVLFAAFHFGAKKLPNDPVGLALKPFGDFIPLLFVVPALLFMVNGYEVDRQELRIGRLLWMTRFPLNGLTRIWYDPEAMRGSIRVFGNGGLYAFTGVYQNKSLGRYRVFVTDPQSAVVLVLPSRTIVISPEDPVAFVRTVRNLFPSAGGE